MISNVNLHPKALVECLLISSYLMCVYLCIVFFLFWICHHSVSFFPSDRNAIGGIAFASQLTPPRSEEVWFPGVAANVWQSLRRATADIMLAAMLSAMPCCFPHSSTAFFIFFLNSFVCLKLSGNHMLLSLQEFMADNFYTPAFENYGVPWMQTRTRLDPRKGSSTQVVTIFFGIAGLDRSGIDVYNPGAALQSMILVTSCYIGSRHQAEIGCRLPCMASKPPPFFNI